MASWVLVPCLGALRTEVNRLAPGRDQRSDGSVGDLAHQDSSSDHNPDETGETPYEDADSTNEVHAIDLDASGPWPAGWSMERIVQTVVMRHRNGLDDRLQNVIYKRRIWSRSWGWTQRAYTGKNAHTEHAHFSARYTTAQERDTRWWGIYREVTVMATQFNAEDKTELKAAATAGVLAYAGGGLPNWPNQPATRNFLNAFSVLFEMVEAMAGQVAALQAANTALQASLDSLTLSLIHI